MTWRNNIESAPYTLRIQNIDLKNSNDSMVFYNPWRIYAPDRKHYLDYEFKSFLGFKFGKLNVKLYDNSNRLIGKVKHVSPFEHVIWFNDFLLLTGLEWNFSVAPNNQKTLKKDRKIVLEFSTGYKKKIETLGSFFFIGQSSDKAYFESNLSNQVIDKISVPNAHSLVSISKKSVLTEKTYNKNDFPLFKENLLSIDYENEKILALYKNQNVSNFNSYLTPFSAANDSYFINDTSLLCFNNSEIYQITANKINQLIDLKTLSKGLKIYSFRIANGKIFFLKKQPFQATEKSVKTLNSVNLEKKENVREFYEIGIIDMKSKKIVYPLMKIKK